MKKTSKIFSLFILLIGLAVMVRSTMLAGGLALTTGMLAGLAFAAFGAVRLYYLRGRP